MISVDHQAFVVLGEPILSAGLSLLILVGHVDPANAQGGKQGCSKRFEHLFFVCSAVVFVALLLSQKLDDELSAGCASDVMLRLS